GDVIPLADTVTTIGRGSGVDIRLADPSVSRLHAEIVRHGPYAYVADLGLSRNGTRVNGRLVARRVLEEGDVLSFGAARCRVGGQGRGDPGGRHRGGGRAAALGEPRVDPPGTRCVDVLVPSCPFRRGLRRPGDRPRDRGRSRRHRGGGQAASAAALSEVPDPR